MRTVSFTLLAAFALTATSVPAALAGTGGATCGVRNVTQDTQGGSFKTMAAAARGGDTLRIRGTCRSRGVLIDKDLVIRGTDGARLDAGGLGRVLRVRRGASVVSVTSRSHTAGARITAAAGSSTAVT